MINVFMWSSLPEESNEDDTGKENIHIVDKSYRDGVLESCIVLMGLDSLKLLRLCIGLNTVLSWRPPGGCLKNKCHRGLVCNI